MMNIRHIARFFTLLLTVVAAVPYGSAQDLLELPIQPEVPVDTIYNPEIIYSPLPKTYEIAGIRTSGLKTADDYVVIGYSGLSIGDKIEIPGQEITDAVRRFWRQGLYSKVRINVDKIAGDKVWLDIELQQQPRLSEIKFEGTKGSEKKDILERLSMVEGQQLTPNIINRAKQIVENYYEKKGFKNVSVNIRQSNDLSKENHSILTFVIQKNAKVKVHKIYIDGNQVMSDRKIKRAMKKTTEKNDILKLFSQKKFVESDYEDDKQRIIDKYNELGYRDAKIVHDSVAKYDDKTVDVFLDVDEGKK